MMMMNWEKQQNQHQQQHQHQQQQQQQQEEVMNNGGGGGGGNSSNNSSNGGMFVKVMTDEQMEILRKQIAAYATICENLVEMHKSLTSHPDLLSEPTQSAHSMWIGQISGGARSRGPNSGLLLMRIEPKT